MSNRPLDGSGWKEKLRPESAAPRHSTPPIADSLDLPPAAIKSGAWHDDFLLLGSRLRPIFSEQVGLDEQAPAYVIPFAPEIEVYVACVFEAPGERAERVRVSCPVIALPTETKGIFEFALRENAGLPLASLSYKQGVLEAEHELPFAAAGMLALRAAIDAVGEVVCSLGPELRAGYLSH